MIKFDPFTRLGLAIFSFFEHLYGGVAMLGRVVLDLLAIARKPKITPWTEISANIYNAGTKAMPITALVAFLIGIVLSYLSAQQLRLFGANQYIVNILGLSVIRELGPVLAAILVAGRSGSAITAQIGVMRVTEELDAMRVMGIPHGLRLILPRVVALGVAMPLLVMWTNIIALTGGALAAKIALGIDMSYFVRALPSVVPVANLWIGLGKGVAFGMLIAIVALSFRFPYQGQFAESRRRHDDLGGDLDHHRDSRGRRVRDPLPERGARMIAPLTQAVRGQPMPSIAEPVIEVIDVTKRYGRNIVHQHLNLDVRRGEIVSIVGGSGSGKTTLVRQILGLERPSSGTIKLFGENLATISPETALLMRSRSGMLFQRGALFSSLSVFDNIAQPVRELGKVPEDLLRDIVMLKLEMVGLPCKHASKMPSALSGGMIKRVGIARAIALEPELLFLDEPTAGLDPQASDEFVELISALHRALGLTVVMVTHDLDTMVALSTRVAVLADRKVLVAAPVEEAAAVDHPFIREYFLGLRGRRALQALPPERRARLPRAALEPASSELPL